MHNDKIFLELEGERMVIFADILGFSEKIRGITNHQDSIRKCIETHSRTTCIGDFSSIYKSIVEEDNSDEIQLERDYRFLWISDSIVLVSKYENAGFLLDRIACLSLKLSTFNMLLRGGISCGNIHYANNIIGVPYIEAVEIEKKAKYPRILISTENYKMIFSHLKDKYAVIKDFLKETEDENFLEFDYIGYNICGGLFGKFYRGALEQYIALFKYEMDLLCMDNNNQEKTKVLDKYVWLRKKLVNIIENHRTEIDNDKKEKYSFENSNDMLDAVQHYKVIDIA